MTGIETADDFDRLLEALCMELNISDEKMFSLIVAHGEAVKARDDDLASLREQLTEAREIIGKLTEKWEKYRHLFDGISDDEAPRHEIEILDVDLATLRRARAFLKGETDNG